MTLRSPPGSSRDAGRQAVTAPGDVRDEAFCHSLVERTVSELGGLDVLVSNAAYQMSIEGIEDLSTEQLLRTYHTNVFATFWLCKAAVRHMQPGSSIIITTSIQAYQPSPSLLDYASTKGALGQLHQGAVTGARPEGHPGQHRGARTHLDAADPGDHAGGTGRLLRRGDPHRPCRTAGGARPGLRVPGFPGVQLHHR
jgi:NAD(P)-dependent dehydrogenase (short-subunit alcohol dehydrogenase family)